MTLAALVSGTTVRMQFLTVAHCLDLVMVDFVAYGG